MNTVAHAPRGRKGSGTPTRAAFLRFRRDPRGSGFWQRVTLLLLVVLPLVLLPLLAGCGVGYLVEVPIRESGWQGLRGRLVDAGTGQAIPQVRVVVRQADAPAPKRPYYVFSGRDGAFQLNRVTHEGEPEPLQPGGRYVLLFSTPTHRVRQIPVNYRGGVLELGILELSADAVMGRMRPVVPGKLTPEGLRDPDALRRIGPPVF